jgi:predicted ferric reductase
MIVPFVFSCWHFHTATKPYANSSAWGRWFQALMLLGIFTWIYRVIWRDILRRGRKYVVHSITNAAGITSLQLMPIGRAIKYRAGQFAFIRLGKNGFGEPHPFTIASHPSEPILRFEIKELGDWSTKIARSTSVGDSVVVEGPFGRLRLFPRRQADVLWIAGGVGITPFLGALRDPRSMQVKPHLFYAVRTRSEAAGLDEVMQAHADGRVVLHLHVSDEKTRLCEDDIRSTFGNNGLASAHVVMCGPESLVRNMTKIVRDLGARTVHHEAFDIRTGVGPDLSVDIDEIVGKIRRKDVPQ